MISNTTSEVTRIVGPWKGKGGDVFTIWMKCCDDKHRKVFAASDNLNFKRWKQVIDAGVGTTLNGCFVYTGNNDIIDGDSPVEIL
tara:strand:- start:451 stop:705 length:255 start_codon:yes stop_codon:yes gene_type:complete